MNESMALRFGYNTDHERTNTKALTQRFAVLRRLTLYPTGNRKRANPITNRATKKLARKIPAPPYSRMLTYIHDAPNKYFPTPKSKLSDNAWSGKRTRTKKNPTRETNATIQ